MPSVASAPTGQSSDYWPLRCGVSDTRRSDLEHISRRSPADLAAHLHVVVIQVLPRRKCVEHAAQRAPGAHRLRGAARRCEEVRGARATACGDEERREVVVGRSGAVREDAQGMRQGNGWRAHLDTETRNTLFIKYDKR